MPCRNNPVPIYPILESAITTNGIKKQDIASALSVDKKTLSNKLTGKTEFSFSEACLIADMFSGIDIRELFKKNGRSI